MCLGIRYKIYLFGPAQDLSPGGADIMNAHLLDIGDIGAAVSAIKTVERTKVFLIEIEDGRHSDQIVAGLCEIQTTLLARVFEAHE